MKSVVVLTVVLLAALTGCEEQEPQESTRPPNVLFIVVDDLNDWVGALGGHPQARTPNIDALAARGMLFSNAHAPGTSCNPSRAAVLTGVPPWRSGVYNNRQDWRERLPDAVPLPQYFRRHGYFTAGAGKIFHGGFPHPASWDEYWPSKERERPPDPEPRAGPLNDLGESELFDWGPVDAPLEEMGDFRVTEWVAERLAQLDDERPFFLTLGIYRPHLPWHLPRDYFESEVPVERIVLPPSIDDDLADVPAAGRRVAQRRLHASLVEAGEWESAVQAYLASVRFADDRVGRALEALDRSGHADDTIVVLWSDHGFHLGEKSHWRKFTLWERTAHVPLIVVAPPGVPGLGEGVSPGTRSSRPVSLQDLYRTLSELAGLPAPPQSVAGRSLVPLLRDPQASWDGPALTTLGPGAYSVRDEHMRIRYADGSEELYDHRDDPNEWHNLAARPESRAVVERLEGLLPDS